MTADRSTVPDQRFPKTDHDHRRCVSSALAQAESVCAAAGLRLTPIRRRVLELIWLSHKPVLAYDLIERLSTERRRTAPPTVYRALDFLLVNGLIHRLESLNAFIGCPDPRDDHSGQFLVCDRCRDVAELADPEIAASISRKASELGFMAGRQTVEISGLCPRCRA